MSRSLVRRELGHVLAKFAEADRRYLRSPRVVWLLAAFPVLYLVLAACTRLAGAWLFTEEGPIVFLALGIPFWLSAKAWHTAPTRAVRYVAARVVVLGEVLIGLCLLHAWRITTVPPNFATELGLVLVLMCVLGVQGLAGLLCLLLANAGSTKKPYQHQQQ